MNTEKKRKMDKQQVLNQLRNAKEIYNIISLCTKMPYVVCDKGYSMTRILLYFKEEDIRHVRGQAPHRGEDSFESESRR